MDQAIMSHLLETQKYPAAMVKTENNAMPYSTETALKHLNDALMLIDESADEAAYEHESAMGGGQD